MNNTIINFCLIVFLFLSFLSSFLIIIYKQFALIRGWGIGLQFLNNYSLLKIISYFLMIISLFIAFTTFKWYFVVIGILSGLFLSGIAGIYEEKTQIIATFLLSISCILGAVLLATGI